MPDRRLTETREGPLESVAVGVRHAGNGEKTVTLTLGGLDVRDAALRVQDQGLVALDAVRGEQVFKRKAGLHTLMLS